jgi:hypothetical protein
MTVSLKHIFQSAKTDSADVTIVQPSNWNEEHELTLATNKVLGRATAGTGAAEELSIGTALSISGGTLAVTTVPAANGGTGLTSPGTSGNVLTSNGTGWTSAAVSAPVNYAQNIQTSNYTLVLGDAGKQIFHPASDANVRTFTIPANSSVAFPIGTVVLFTVENAGTQVNVAITSDTLVNGTGLTGTQPVLPNNTLMCVKVTATKWMANYLYQKDARSRFQFAVGHQASPYVSAYPWSSNTGIGSIFNNPATLPTGDGNGVAFTPAGDAIAVAHNTTPFVSAYPWSATGFGTKYANPATLPTGTGQGIAFSPASDAIAVAHQVSPFISAYPWNSSTGFGTKYANPATLPAAQGTGVAFSPDGASVAVAHQLTPFVSAYPWTVASGFGTKYTNPATLPASDAKSVAFHPAGNAIIIGHNNTPFISAYPWSSSTGFGTKYTNPGALPPGAGNGVAFSPAGDAVAMVANSGAGTFIYTYRWTSAGFGQQYSAPSTLPPSLAYGVAFSPTADAIATANFSTSFMAVYPWSGSAGYGTQYTYPFTLPAGVGLSVAFNAII